ncbi:hypothetical protein EBT25_16220 [bacterium]|nr:hypothetical protein [bacterium]
MANGETVTGTDGAGPVLMSANPTHSKTGVRSTQSITLTYSEAPASWSGSITGGVSLSAATGTATVTLTHVARFLTGINAVTISSSPDAGGNAFAGSQTGNTTVANPLVFQVTSGSSSDTSSQEDIFYSVNLLFPEEDEFLNGGEYTDIRWESEGGSVSYVNLSYSKNGGDDWQTIALHERNDGVFRWMTPEVNSDEVMVKISLTDLASELATDTSDVFTLWFSDEDGSMGVGDEEDGEVSDEENITQGSYIKLENSPAIYYIDALLTRRPFFDVQTFFTYEDDFDDVLEVSLETLASFPVGAPMLPKAGVALVKIQSVEKVYMVEEASDGSYELRWITSEEVAEDMFGSQWSSYVLDIDVTLFVRYKKGEDIDSAIPVDTDYMKYREDLHE